MPTSDEIQDSDRSIRFKLRIIHKARTEVFVFSRASSDADGATGNVNRKDVDKL